MGENIQAAAYNAALAVGLQHMILDSLTQGIKTY